MMRFPAFTALVPQEIKIQLSTAIMQEPNLGYSILELGHRSDTFETILNEARDLTRRLLNIPDNFEIFFLQGSGSFGFVLSAYNMQGKYKKAGFLETDFWATKAMEAATQAGIEVEVLASSKQDNFKYIPNNKYEVEYLDYLHFTSNNTVAGTQFSVFPQSNVPLVSDMTADIFTRKIDFSNIGLIYAGLQKSLCATGLGLYIIDKKYLRERSNVPNIFNLYEYYKVGGVYHTPNMLGIYAALLMLRWTEAKGGISYFEMQNEKKYSLIYEVLENNSAFQLHAEKADRSKITITFFLADEKETAHFDHYLIENGISDIHGHRSAKGYRISLYNTISLENTEFLAEVLRRYCIKRDVVATVK